MIAGEIGLTPKEAASVFAVYATIDHEAIWPMCSPNRGWSDHEVKFLTNRNCSTNPVSTKPGQVHKTSKNWYITASIIQI